MWNVSNVKSWELIGPSKLDHTKACKSYGFLANPLRLSRKYFFQITLTNQLNNQFHHIISVKMLKLLFKESVWKPFVSIAFSQAITIYRKLGMDSKFSPVWILTYRRFNAIVSQLRFWPFWVIYTRRLHIWCQFFFGKNVTFVASKLAARGQFIFCLLFNVYDF